MDMMMPGASGQETAEYLQAIGKFSGIPVVFLTGVVSENAPEGGASIDVGGEEYPMILKTVGREELVRRVRLFLSGTERKTTKVLLVEDSPTDAHFIGRLLQKSVRRNFEVHREASLHEAQEYLQRNPVDVIVLDLALPDSRKNDTLLWMLKQQLPIVVITGDDDEATVGEAFRHGAQDYLVKGDFSDREIARCVIYALERQMVNKELLMYKNNFERLVQDRVNELLKERNS